MHPEYKNDGVSPFPGNSESDPIAKNKVVLTLSVVWPDRKLKVASTTEDYTLSVAVDDSKVT